MAALAADAWPEIPSTPDDWEALRAKAQALGSDGCTGVADVYTDCCYLHDVLWHEARTEADFDRADLCLQECIRRRSFLKRHSLLARLRYWGVRTFGKWFFRPVRALRALLAPA